jgi:hypothetical protein
MYGSYDASQVELRGCSLSPSRTLWIGYTQSHLFNESLMSSVARSDAHFGQRACRLFHNGAGGYGAQFYESIRQGEQANRYILDRLSHIDREILKSRTAKIWIYQGQWLRRQRHAMRNLRVERWHRNFHVCPKLVRYGYLTPDNETRLVIKGESPKSLDDRNERIYNYGYT